MWSEDYAAPVVILCCSALAITTLIMVGAW